MHTQSSKCLLQDSDFEFIGKIVAKGAVIKPAVVQIQILRFTFLVLGMSSQTLDSTVCMYMEAYPFIEAY